MMTKIALFAMAAILASTPIARAEITRTTVIQQVSDNPSMFAQVKAVCANNMPKSDKLTAACKDDNVLKALRVTKKGALYNVGIGAELNTLMRVGTVAKAADKPTEQEHN
jgi:hypothetical protein